MSHHSVANLMMELFQLQIKPEESPRGGLRNNSDWDNSDDEKESEDKKEEGTLTASQLKQKEILEAKHDEQVMKLLDTLSSKNTHELEKSLNASAILMDFYEQNHSFNILTKPAALNRLTQICCEGNENKQNLPYALHLLTTIINEFSNTEKDISDDHKVEIYQLFQEFFNDMAYNCIMLFYDQQDETY